MFRTSDGWVRVYKEKKALLTHDGNPKRPHPLLTSENHSNGFFNSRLVIPDKMLLREAASDLLELFMVEEGYLSQIECVVGPQTGATKLAQLLSEEVNDRIFLSACTSASPVKSEKDGKKSMVFDTREIHMLSDHSVLLCEDVLTTGGSVGLTAEAATNAGGIVLPFILALVNRSGLTEVNYKKIVALINRHMPIWTPEKCPLCKVGSEAISAKDPENWARLNASY